MTNKQLIAKYNATETKSVCARSYPYIGGYRAEFFQNVGKDGGWLIATDSTGPASQKQFAYEIPQATVNRADAIEFDVYNDAAYAKALLALSDECRGL